VTFIHPVWKSTVALWFMAAFAVPNLTSEIELAGVTWGGGADWALDQSGFMCGRPGLNAFV
jgi:hypothetical protein